RRGLGLARSLSGCGPVKSKTGIVAIEGNARCAGTSPRNKCTEDAAPLRGPCKDRWQLGDSWPMAADADPWSHRASGPKNLRRWPIDAPAIEKNDAWGDCERPFPI